MNQAITTKRKRHILVVDDSDDMRILLGQILEKAGHHVIFAEDGQTALAQAQLYHPSLILMDLSLPDMSGWEVVSRLRQKSEFLDTPIIAVTAHVSSDEVERARAVGCTTHIGKPFDCAILLRSVTRLLSSSAYRP